MRKNMQTIDEHSNQYEDDVLNMLFKRIFVFFGKYSEEKKREIQLIRDPI